MCWCCRKCKSTDFFRRATYSSLRASSRDFSPGFRRFAPTSPCRRGLAAVGVFSPILARRALTRHKGQSFALVLFFLAAYESRLSRVSKKQKPDDLRHPAFIPCGERGMHIYILQYIVLSL